MTKYTYMLKKCVFNIVVNLDFTKDTYREKAHFDKSSTLTKSMNMDIWVVSTSMQLFLGGS